jgi:hypothetical protein
VGAACGPFAGVFGNANATLYYMPHETARVIKFPARRVKSGNSDGSLLRLTASPG